MNIAGGLNDNVFTADKRRKYFFSLTSNFVTSASANSQLRHVRFLSVRIAMKTTFPAYIGAGPE